jgi:O-antigen/teichoic acid export membrane protein
MPEIVWNTIKLVGGTAIAQLVSILLSPVLTRVFTPEDFGAYGVFLSLLSILIVISSARYELAIVLPEDHESGITLLGVSIIISSVFATIVWVIILIFGGRISTLLNAPVLENYLWLLAPMIFVTGSYNALNYWNIRVKQFEVIAFTDLLNTIFTSVLMIVFGVFSYANLSGMVYGNFLGSFIALATQIVFFFRKINKNLIKHCSLNNMISLMKRYRKFPIYTSWAALINNFSSHVPSFMLTGLFSAEVNGFFVLGKRALQMPSGLIGQALAKVFFQSATQAKIDGEIGLLVEKMMTKLINIGIFPILMLTIIGQDIITVIFGNNWAEAGVYIQIMSFWTLAVFISSPLSSLFSVLEKNETGLKFNVVLMLSRIVALYAGYFLGSARWGLVFFSLSGVIAYGWLGIYLIRAAKSDFTRLNRNISRFMLFYAPLLVEVIIFQILFHGRSLLISINAFTMGLAFVIILIRKDPDVKTIFNSMLKKIQFFRHEEIT